METGPDSQSWYRVAHLRPEIASRAEVSRQYFRGTPWYVLRDPLTGKFNRLSEPAYFIVGQMDGRRSVGEIWDIACSEFEDDAPTQDELIAIVTQLNTIDLLRTDGMPGTRGIAERGDRTRRRGLIGRFLNPLALKFPLFDPDSLLNELWPLFSWLFTRLGALLYVILLCAGLLTASQNWEPLTRNLIDQALAAESLAILILVYPFVKLLHEIGHGLAVKKWGGEVREVGVMFLVFLPVPYVDASAASAFEEKWRRILVGAAGILVELALASVAILVWTELEPGFWRAVCFNVVLIGGISTLLFNGNPLLRFDGYYVLADLVEIPNLGARSNKYLGYLIQHYLFGVENARSPVRARGERGWFFFYSIAAFIYRIFISIAIVSIVATRFFFVGVVFAVWSVTLMFLLPLARHLKFLLSSSALRGRRGRAWTITAGIGLATVSFFAFVPAPYRTVAEGVIAAPEGSAIHAGEAGSVSRILARSGDTITVGAPVLQLADLLIDARLGVARADAERVALRYREAVTGRAIDARLWRAQADRAVAEVEILEGRRRALEVGSPRTGTLVLPREADMLGRFFERGDLIGHVVEPSDFLVRVALPQEVADLIRRRTVSVALRPASDLRHVVPGRVVREVPTVGGALASPALSTEGGGRFLLDASSRESLRTLQEVMHVDVAPEAPLLVSELGMRIYVRFDHGAEPLAHRIGRRVRQLFLSRFNV